VLSLLSLLSHLLVLVPSSLSLVCHLLCSGLLQLLLVDKLHQNSLVLEYITLRFKVKFVVHVDVNLLCGSVLLKESSEDTETSDPQNLHWHTGIGCSLPLTSSHVSSLPSGLCMLSSSGSGVDGYWFLDDEPILNQLLDLQTRVGISNFGRLIGIQPHLVFSAFENR